MAKHKTNKSKQSGIPLIAEPPNFCEYAGAACDQTFGNPTMSDGLFAYPSEPEIIASTIEESIPKLRSQTEGRLWVSWKDLDTSGQIIFCKICTAFRFTKLVIADVTTLNFNLLFEIGYALGLGQPVLPIRDTSYIQDHKIFDELGLLDTLGYIDFQNSTSLAEGVTKRIDDTPPFHQYPSLNTELPLFIVKSHIQSEGMIKLMSVLKKSGLRFRTFDPREVSRLSLHEAFKQVCSSYGVIAHLVAPGRVGALAHNSRCAFLAGMSMAAGRFTLMLQETEVPQPIDYRDVVKSYSRASNIPDLLVPLIKSVVEMLQERRFIATALPLRQLEKIDLGDLAAENEIGALRTYFVPTGQYNEAKRGHARLVVGRKGAGKTAIFYSVRNAYKPSKDHMVLDLKPEGHQFTKLRETILQELSPGLRQHVMTAFWNYLLLMEIAHKIVKEEERYAYRDYDVKDAYERVVTAYGGNGQLEEADFSERLLRLVDDILARRKDIAKIASTADVTQLVYKQDISPLSATISDYLKVSRKEDVWLLFDNLDKGWPVTCATPEDIMILRCLLEATRKIQRQFESRNVDFHAIVFIRNDIYQHLVVDPADRGKETAVLLDWNDPEVFKEIIRRRIIYSTQLEQPFDILWPHFFETHINGEESFSYILNRTLMRPREILHFTRESIDTAVNRGHEIVTQADILKAEQTYSCDLLVDLTYDLKDVSPDYADIPYAFIGSKVVLSKDEVKKRLADVKIPSNRFENAIELLLWFGFFGIYVSEDEERYSYKFQHDIKTMQSTLKYFAYCIHPGFRKALSCQESS
ncbi:MAG: hypothetical protein FJ005_04005 [Chloroflexi bacterium]|nr:hypothetical protein [Chloroflexota bacterium]